jgi:phosphoribosyl 1,2-cyclic phosphate phosphodiesterase
MSQRLAPQLVFLGTSGPIQVPSFHCSCRVCEAARVSPRHRRTRASAAVIGEEIVLIDAGPDLEYQLEREAIRRVNRVLITHWHFDHVGGLPALAVPQFLGKWPRIEVYLPQQIVHHFDQELAYMKDRVDVHPIQPGDRFELPDATWEVVKTTHTDHSVGFIVRASGSFAYLGDGVTPPVETMECLKDLDFVVLNATVDELSPGEGERWMNFSLQQSIACWRRIGVRKCILTHLSCHGWREGRLVAGLPYSERSEWEARIAGLTFAYDGMHVSL